jgi:hypothetical protein
MQELEKCQAKNFSQRNFFALQKCGADVTSRPEQKSWLLDPAEIKRYDTGNVADGGG